VQVLAVGTVLAVRVDVLAEQRHFDDAIVDERAHLGHQLLHRAALLAAARGGHDAEGAAMVAPARDRHERAERVGADGNVHGRRRRVVADGDDRATTVFRGRGKVEDFPERAGAGNDVDVRRAARDVATEALGHAAGDAEQHAGIALLVLFQLAQNGKDLVLRMLTHGAGVDEDDIGIGGFVGAYVAATLERGDYQVPVVDVHLAAEALEEQLLRAPTPGVTVRRGLGHASYSDSIRAACSVVARARRLSSSLIMSRVSLAWPPRACACLASAATPIRAHSPH